MEDRPETIESGHQKRYVSLLYVDLCGSTRLATELEDEDYGDILNRLNGIYREIIPRHGGTPLQVHGDGVLAMFGFPNAGEEDVRLAVNTALDLHAAVRALHITPPNARRPLELRLHSGVHSGAVIIEQGDLLAGSYQLRGEATNITARLSDAAGEDEILVSEESLRGSEPFYACDDMRDLELRGLEASLKAIPVLEQTAVQTRYQARRARSLLAFTGRDEQLAELAARWQRAQSGEVQVAAVVGAPGVGKTRLVDEFLALPELSGALVMRGHAQSFEGRRSLEPMRSLLRDVFGQAGRVNGATARAGLAAGELMSFLEDADQALPPTEFARVFRDYVAELLHGQAVVIFMDDWQWADEMSRGVLLEVLNTVVGRLLIVLTSRPGQSAGGLYQEADAIDLDGLVRSDVDAALQIVLPGSNPNVRHRLAELSGGNPLYLEELCQAQNLEDIDGTPSPIEHVPRWLYSLVQSRVATLPPAELSVVQLAAVIGASVPMWLMQAVTPADDVQALSGLTMVDLLRPGLREGELVFRHGLTREIVYDLIDVRDRRRLHRSIVEALIEADSDNLELLAYHAAQAGMREESIRYAERAGDAAAAAGSLETARTQYALAMSALDLGYEEDVEPYAALARKLMAVAIIDPSTAELPFIEALLDNATAPNGNEVHEAMANHWLGAIYYGLGRPRRALRHYTRALALAQAQGIRWMVKDCDHRMGQAMVTNGDHAAALRILDRAISRMNDPAPGSLAAIGLAYSLGAMSMMLGDQGRFERATELYARSRAYMGAQPHPAGPNIASKWAAVLIWQGRWAEARQRADETARFSEGNQNLYVYGMCQVLSAYAGWHEQRPDQRDQSQIQRIRDTVAWLEGSGLRQFASLNYAWLSELSLAVGAYDDVRKYGARAIWRARAGDELGLAAAMRALSRLSLRGGTRRDAEAYLALAQKSAARRESPRERAHNDVLGAELAAAQGNEVGERMLLARAGEAYDELGMHWHRAQLAERL